MLRSALAQVVVADSLAVQMKGLPLGIAALDEWLPDGGLPRGAVTELVSHVGLSKLTSFALRACASAQAALRQRSSEHTAGFCAWIDPTRSLFAKGVAQASVDLERLLIVASPLSEVSRAAVRLAQSHLFAVLVVDAVGISGSSAEQNLSRWLTTIRKLSISVEGTDTCVLLLTNARTERTPLPVSLRLEFERQSRDALIVRVAKDRKGRLPEPLSLSLANASQWTAATHPSISNADSTPAFRRAAS